jgi:hypothetical protein
MDPYTMDPYTMDAVRGTPWNGLGLASISGYAFNTEDLNEN